MSVWRLYKDRKRKRGNKKPINEHKRFDIVTHHVDELVFYLKPCCLNVLPSVFGFYLRLKLCTHIFSEHDSNRLLQCVFLWWNSSFFSFILTKIKTLPIKKSLNLDDLKTGSFHWLWKFSFFGYENNTLSSAISFCILHSLLFLFQYLQFNNK